MGRERALIDALKKPAVYPHTTKRTIKIIQTHISWVFLTGRFAYKIKKPLKYDFVDFSTLAKRKFYCHEELRLNQVLAPTLYLQVIPITGSILKPILNGTGKSIEYALKMREFPQDKLLHNLISTRTVNRQYFFDLAQTLAQFHKNAKQAPLRSHWGNFESIKKDMLDNFLKPPVFLNASEKQHLKILKQSTGNLLKQHASLIKHRKKSKYIRNCHGDLQLGNLVLLDKKIVAFDRVEFNENFRMIDTLNDIAFLTMDLKFKNQTSLAYYFLNQYLTLTGDYAGLPLLKMYEVYRAMIRAKVASLTRPVRSNLYRQYLKLAYQLSHSQAPFLIILCGVSGSGKTWLSRSLAANLQAIHLRSDVERKRLFPGLQGAPLYTSEKTQKTFQRLYSLTEYLLKNKNNVIVDAAFLKKSTRQYFYKLSQELKLPFLIIACDAPMTTLKKRIQKRKQAKKDYSDATLSVLKQQLKAFQPLSHQERALAIELETQKSLNIPMLIKKICLKLKRLKVPTG